MRFRSSFTRLTLVLSGLVLTLLAVGATPPRATVLAQTDTQVTVVIERLRGFGCWGSDTWLGCIGGESADFYGKVRIDGGDWIDRPTIDDQHDIRPNWEFSRSVPLSRGTIPIVIQVWDEDGGFRGSDDHVDLTQAGGDDLELMLDLRACTLTGNLPGGTGRCNLTLIDRGGASTDKAEIWFRVTTVDPPRSGDLRVRCLHEPLWPQPGDSVTFTATGFEEQNGRLIPLASDRLEIWVNERTGPVRACDNAGNCTVTRGPFSGESLNYGCRVRDGADVVFTGWRTVDVGMPRAGRAVRAVYNGPRHDKVDLVFAPDGGNYPGGTRDAAFLTAVHRFLELGYYNENIYLSHQDTFNVWLALDTGDAKNDCDTEAPGNWDEAYGFADAGGIVHNDPTIRDCAPGGERYFSVSANGIRVALHETGHRPFGLADEYCCDGGYFMRDQQPNLYEEPSDCRSDIINLGPFDIALGLPARSNANCREFNDDGWWIFSKDWSVSDPANNDIMADNLAFQGADLRRLGWFFEHVCSRLGRC